jgi:hypothetical protein
MWYNGARRACVHVCALFLRNALEELYMAQHFNMHLAQQQGELARVCYFLG